MFVIPTIQEAVGKKTIVQAGQDKNLWSILKQKKTNEREKELRESKDSVPLLHLSFTTIKCFLRLWS
jgi:hypothetical protein